MAKKAKKDKKFVIRCAHCLVLEFKLHDVKPDDKVKIYTDTPFKLGIFSPGGNFLNQSGVKCSTDKQKDLTPCKFSAVDESTAFKSNIINSADGKIYEEFVIEPLRKIDLVQVEEEKQESEHEEQYSR